LYYLSKGKGRALEKVEGREEKDQAVSPGDRIWSKLKSLPKETLLFDLGLKYSEPTEILKRTQDTARRGGT
jgi:hypothetical protein